MNICFRPFMRLMNLYLEPCFPIRKRSDNNTPDPIENIVIATKTAFFESFDDMSSSMSLGKSLVTVFSTKGILSAAVANKLRALWSKHHIYDQLKKCNEDKRVLLYTAIVYTLLISKDYLSAYLNGQRSNYLYTDIEDSCPIDSENSAQQVLTTISAIALTLLAAMPIVKKVHGAIAQPEPATLVLKWTAVERVVHDVRSFIHSPNTGTCAKVAIFSLMFPLIVPVYAINYSYKKYYQLPFLPNISFLNNTLFGDYNKKYQPLAIRLNNQLRASLIDTLPADGQHSNNWRMDSFETRLFNLFAGRVREFFTKVANRTLDETDAERINLIKAVQGLLLRSLWDKAFPSEDTCIREIAIGLVSPSFLAPCDWLVTRCTSNVVSEVPDLVSKVSSVYGNCAGALLPLQYLPLNDNAVSAMRAVPELSGKMAARVLTKAALEYGPFVYQFSNDVNRWAESGQKTMEGHPSVNKFIQKQAGTLEEYIDIGYVSQIFFGCAGDMFNTMSKNPKLSLNQNMFVLMKKVLFDVIDEFRRTDNTEDNKVSNDSGQQAGMAEAKQALREMLEKTFKVFFQEMISEITAELVRQGKDAKDVFGNINQKVKSAKEKQAQAVSSLFLGVITPEAALEILTTPERIAGGLSSGLKDAAVKTANLLEYALKEKTGRNLIA